ncbi:DNA-directed RNA polymerase subunit beta [Nocardia sp. NBC_00508]|uniref:DNA-directed RNA polymerase subunit beta n=1 Tax=Nocardia sp. NBC_00508 TaxID=2975992 RepID=UPI002E80E82F|nr:DNA-directed RNA polymerase subunit beta [Nocardia sp. NBC_00508]WUD67977.1 DNA-directed RNA polymerase subunit beta [Nocardia sp. NBC_00508]
MRLDDTRVLPPVPADTPLTRCRFYRETCGLPARVLPEIGSIIVPAGRVGAITMPHQLGAAVKTRMHNQRVQPGPIVSHPRSKRWTFLIVPDVPDENRLFAELFRLNVSVSRFGAHIALPSPGARQAGFRVWVSPPRDDFRPSGMAVIESIRACQPQRRR